jgi:hypothetical protein
MNIVAGGNTGRGVVRSSLIAWLIISGIVLSAPAQARTIYVDGAATGANNGTGWADAYVLLQSGLDAAVSNDEIWVAAGTYKPTSDYGLGIGQRGKHFRMKNGVGIYGGFAGMELTRNERDWRGNITVLSGDIGVQDDKSDNCYHVFYHPAYVSLDITTILDGCTVTAGNANGTFPHDSGGGILMQFSAPTVEDCIFAGNSAKTYGGAIYDYCGSPLIRTCVFAGNRGLHGAGVTTVWGYPNLNSCLFVGNNGTALDTWGWASQVLNCTIVANDGYGVECYNSTKITNSILWGNVNGEILGADALVTYSDIQGGYSGIGNSNGSPMFARDPNAGPDGVWGTVDDDYGDLRLRAGSLCVDTGNNIDANSPTDLAGNSRIVDGNGDGVAKVDMGAYERQCVANPVGDISYDCGVEFADYAMLAGKWNQTGCSASNWWCSGADIGHDGIVDMRDMAAMAAHWLEGI